MANIIEQRSMGLPPELWPVLEQLAAQTNSVAERGIKARKPSVQVMLKRIGLGEITVAEVHPWSLPAGLAEQAAEIERQERQEQQERVERLERQRRVEAQAKPQHKTPPVKLEQLSILDLEPA